jgi:hypothetical protein
VTRQQDQRRQAHEATTEIERASIDRLSLDRSSTSQLTRPSQRAGTPPREPRTPTRGGRPTGEWVMI